MRALNARRVRYVVIGGVAAQVHDLPLPATVDLDVTPARDPTNLGRLAKAFDDLDAGLLTAEDAGAWFPRRPVGNWAQYDTLHLMTKYGPLDVVVVPDGAPGGYDDLAASATERAVQGEDARALVISVTTWSRLKEATAALRTWNTSTCSTATKGTGAQALMTRRAANLRRFSEPAAGGHRARGAGRQAQRAGGIVLQT